MYLNLNKYIKMGNDAKYAPERNPRQEDSKQRPNQMIQERRPYDFPPTEPYRYPLSNYPHYSLPPSSSYPIPYETGYPTISRIESTPYPQSPYRSSPTRVTVLPYQGYENHSYKPQGREFPHYSRSSYSNYPSQGERVYSPSKQVPKQVTNPNIYPSYPEYRDPAPQYNENMVYHAPRLISRTIIPIEESSFANDNQYQKSQLSETKNVQEIRMPSRYSQLESFNSYPVIREQRLFTPSPEYPYRHFEPYRQYRGEGANIIEKFSSPQAYSISKNIIPTNIQKEINTMNYSKNSIKEEGLNKSKDNLAYFKNPKKIQNPNKNANS